MEDSSKKIYARLNKNNIVIKFFSSVFEDPLNTDIFIEEGFSDEYAHVHLKYQLTDSLGRYNYKYVNELLKLTEAEKESISSGPIVIPTYDERIKALEDAILNLI